ncbi:MAG: hypothetical protein V4773_08025 [Verrucomicrobiota bacterium]
MSNTIKQLKLLVIVLVVSNVGLGGFSFYLLRKVDQEYSDIIGRSLPVMNSLQTLTAKAMRAMRATNPVQLGKPAGKQANFLQQATAEFAADRNERLKALRSEWTGATAERTELQESGEAFTKLGTEVVAHYAAGRIEEAASIREDDLRIAFDRYIAAATKAADVLEIESTRLNSDVSARTDNVSSVVLGIATWPIIVVLGILLLTAVFVVGLMILFRERQASDMP